MTISTAAPLATVSSRRSRCARATRVGSWAVRVVLAAQFLLGGLLKLVADPVMVAMFDDIGAGPGLRLLVGACEVAGAVGLLVPRLVRAAAGGLALLMIGATVTNVVVLHTSPVLPVMFGVLAAAVAAAAASDRSRTGA